MLIAGLQLPQRVCQLQQVITVAATGAVAAGNMLGNGLLIGLPKEGSVICRSDIHQPLGLLVVCKGHGRLEAQIAVFLPMIQMPECVRGDAVGHAHAGGAGALDQGNDPAGKLRSASVVM